MFLRKMLTTLLILGFAFTALAQEGSIQKPLRIGFNGGDSPGIIRLKANAFTAFLEEHCGLFLQPVIAKSYSELIRFIVEDKVEFAWLSPQGLITAEDTAEAKVLLKAVRAGQPYYWSVILVRKDSGLRELSDLKGKDFAFTHLGSTSGYVIPKSSLLGLGIEPEDFFSEVVFAGGHRDVINMILSGRVDAGATFADHPRGLVGSWTDEAFHPRTEAAKLRPIYISEKIPGDTFTATKRISDASPENVKKVVEALKAMGETRAGKIILTDLYNIDSLVDAKSEDYLPVREAFERVFQR